MALIQCTQKLFDEFGYDSKQSNIVSLRNTENKCLEGNWHGNLVLVDNAKFILLTHNATLYSFFTPVAGSKVFYDFDRFFIENLIANFAYEGLTDYIEYIVEVFLDNIYPIYGTSNEILGSMNNSRFVLSSEIDVCGSLEKLNILDTNKKINSIPRKYLGFRTSIEILRSKLGLSVGAKNNMAPA